MRTISLHDGHTVDLYQSMHELPAQRHSEFQCRLVQAGGIGSTMVDVTKHFERLAQFLAAGRTEDATEELAHLHYAFNYCLEQFSPASLAFGCLVASVDGTATATKVEDDGLRQLLDRLSGWGLTQGMVEDICQDVKKNCKPS
ncbi:hypothetical protein [Hymenobacter algoricola]